MGAISTNRLGGASLIVGPLLAVVCFLIRPGGGLVGGQVDPADASASINVVTANADLAGISFLLAPIGLLALVYGLNVFAESLKGGNGEALARYGTLFFLLALMSWSVGSALTVAIAGGAAAGAAEALYAAGTAVSSTGGIFAALGLLALSVGVSTRDDFNKPFALIVAATSAILLVFAVLSARDTSLLQAANTVAGIAYAITTSWSVTLGRGLMKKA